MQAWESRALCYKGLSSQCDAWELTWKSGKVQAWESRALCYKGRQSEWFSELTDLDLNSNYIKECEILGKCLSFLTSQCFNFLISKKRLFVKAN